MNHPIIRCGLCLLAFFLARCAFADGNGSLFSPGEVDASGFGVWESGHIDSNTQTSTVTTTHSVNVLAPGTVTPPGGIITVAERPRPAFRFATSLKPLAATPAAAAPTDPVVTTKVRHTVTTNHVTHDAGGGGVQLAYFFSQYVGVAIEGDFLGGDSSVSQLSGQLILRYPFEFGPKSVSGYSKDEPLPRHISRGGDDTSDDYIHGHDDNYSDDYNHPHDQSNQGPHAPAPLPAEAYRSRAANEGSSTEGAATWGLAPYLIVGAGGQFDGHSAGCGDIGGGLEVRFLDHWGLFTDGRWIFCGGSQSFAAVRGGVIYEF